MKISRLIPTVTALCAMTILLLSSCSKDSASSNNSIVTGAPDGSWRVSYFYDTGVETGNFSSYTFSFNSNGQVVATNGSSTITGTWSQGSRFNIDFGADPLLSDLTDDWLIEEKTASSIKLKDDNTTNTEQLQFIKL